MFSKKGKGTDADYIKAEPMAGGEINNHEAGNQGINNQEVYYQDIEDQKIEDQDIENQDSESDQSDIMEIDYEDTPKKKRKKLPWWFIIVILVVLFGVGAIASSLSKSKKPESSMNLKAIEVGTSDVTETLNTSGIIESEHKKVMYSPVNAKISQCIAKVGVAVKKGDKLISFDTKDLEINNQQQQLTALAGQYTNQDAVDKSNESARKSAQATADAANIQAEIDKLQGDVNQLNQQAESEGDSGMVNKAMLESQLRENENLQTKFKSERANAQKTIETINVAYTIKRDESNNVKSQLEGKANDRSRVKAELDTLQAGSPEYQVKADELGRLETEIASLKTKQEECAANIAQLDRELSDSKQIIKNANNELGTLGITNAQLKAQIDTAPSSSQAQAELEAATQKLAALQGELASAQAKSEGLDAGIMSSAQYNAMSANSNLAQLSVLTTAELVQMGKEGIAADFDGVIAAVTAVEGAAAAQGMELFTLVSNTEVGVKIEVSVNDYEKLKVGRKAEIKVADKTYTGEIKTVDKIATTNAKGNSVICAYVHINNPDAEICIGVNAKVKMTAAEAKNVVAIPSEVINTSTSGEFVYAVKDGVVKKVPVKMGVSSDNMVEITKGLKKGDQIVSDVGVEIEEGMKATVTLEKNADAKNKDK